MSTNNSIVHDYASINTEYRKLKPQWAFSETEEDKIEQESGELNKNERVVVANELNCQWEAHLSGENRGCYWDYSRDCVKAGKCLTKGGEPCKA